MEKYKNNVQDQFGNAITGVTVTIRTNPGGVLATIYSDNGVTTKSNPFTNDADGEFFFYAANGRYDIELTGPIVETVTDWLLLDVPSSLSGNVRIIADIVTATPPTTEAVTGALDFFDLDETDLLAQVGHLGSNVFYAGYNQMHGGAVRLSGQNNAGAFTNIFDGDPDGAATIYHAGIARLQARTTGIVGILSDGNTDTENRLLTGYYQDLTARWQIGQPAIDDLFVRNFIHGGRLVLDAEDTGGVPRNLFRGDPDGATNIYAAGVLGFVVQGAGTCNVYGADNLDASNRVIDFRYANGTVRGEVGHGLGGTSIALSNMIHGGNVVLTGETTGGTTRTIFQGDPDGASSLWHGGSTNIQSLRTQQYNIADNVSGAEVLDGKNVWQDIGFNVLGSLLANANKNFQRDDCGYDIRKDAGGAVTYTIPAAANVLQTDIPVGAVFEVTNEDTENLTIDGTQTGITLRWLPAGTTGNRTIAQWGNARLKKRSDSLWFITGVGIT